MKIENKYFQNKFVLVTGSSSGIGYQIAKDFLLLGAKVGVHYNKNSKGAKKLSSINKKNCKLFKADFSKSGEVTKLWKDYIKWTSGKISILINNAGYAKSFNFNNLTSAEWDKCFAINVKSAFILSKLAMKIMSKNRGGRIINISSGGWLYGGGESTVHYSASKAALEGLTKATAKIGANKNILVNTLRPGATKTDFHKKMGRKNLNKRAKLVPLKRMADPSEISNAVIFLSSGQSKFITNSVIDVRGGE